jgi:hypothetical protein
LCASQRIGRRNLNQQCLLARQPTLITKTSHINSKAILQVAHSQKMKLHVVLNCPLLDAAFCESKMKTQNFSDGTRTLRLFKNLQVRMRHWLELFSWRLIALQSNHSNILHFSSGAWLSSAGLGSPLIRSVVHPS